VQRCDDYRSIFGTSKSFAYFNISNDDQYRKFASKMFAATTVRDRVPYLTFNYNMQTLSQVSLLVKLQFYGAVANMAAFQQSVFDRAMLLGCCHSRNTMQCGMFRIHSFDLH
jgi:hypothetical protein